MLYTTAGTQLNRSIIRTSHYIKTSESFWNMTFWSKLKARRQRRAILRQQRLHISLMACAFIYSAGNNPPNWHHSSSHKLLKVLFQVQNRNIDAPVLCSSSETRAWKQPRLAGGRGSNLKFIENISSVKVVCKCLPEINTQINKQTLCWFSSYSHAHVDKIQAAKNYQMHSWHCSI